MRIGRHKPRSLCLSIPASVGMAAGKRRLWPHPLGYHESALRAPFEPYGTANILFCHAGIVHIALSRASIPNADAHTCSIAQLDPGTLILAKRYQFIGRQMSDRSSPGLVQDLVLPYLFVGIASGLLDSPNILRIAFAFVDSRTKARLHHFFALPIRRSIKRYRRNDRHQSQHQHPDILCPNRHVSLFLPRHFDHALTKLFCCVTVPSCRASRLPLLLAGRRA